MRQQARAIHNKTAHLVSHCARFAIFADRWLTNRADDDGGTTAENRGTPSLRVKNVAAWNLFLGLRFDDDYTAHSLSHPSPLPRGAKGQWFTKSSLPSHGTCWSDVPVCLTKLVVRSIAPRGIANCFISSSNPTRDV